MCDRSDMKFYFKVVVMLLAFLMGMRVCSSLALLADQSSDVSVLLGSSGLALLIFFESWLFWFMFLYKKAKKEKEKDETSSST